MSALINRLLFILGWVCFLSLVLTQNSRLELQKFCWNRHVPSFKFQQIHVFWPKKKIFAEKFSTGNSHGVSSLEIVMTISLQMFTAILHPIKMALNCISKLFSTFPMHGLQYPHHLVYLFFFLNGVVSLRAWTNEHKPCFNFHQICTLMQISLGSGMDRCVVCGGSYYCLLLLCSMGGSSSLFAFRKWLPQNLNWCNLHWKSYPSLFYG